MDETIKDAELLRRYADEKSESAFAELVRRHLDLVYSAALRRLGGDAHRAADVAQQVFTTLAREAQKLSRHGVLTAWLYAATRNAAIDLIRSEQRRHAREQEASTMQNLFAATPDAEWTKLRPVLDHVMDELGDADRTAVLLRFFEKRPFADIGAALDVTEDAARRRVERALEKLRALLARRGVTSTTAALAIVVANQAVVAAPAGLLASVTSAALASSATVGAIGILNFMSTTKLVAATVSLVALVAIGTGIYEAKRASASAMSLAAVARERDNLQVSLARAEKRAQQADDAFAAMRKEPEDSRPSAPKPAAATTPAARGTGAIGVSAVDYVLDHPEARAAYIDGEVLRGKAHFERFFKQTALSPAQQDQFLKNLKDYAEARLDFQSAVRAQGYEPNTSPQNLPREIAQQLGRMEKQAPLDLYANMRSLLGDDGYNQFQQYTRTLPARNVVDDVASRLYDTDAPLTAMQAAQLTEIIAQNPFRDLAQTQFQGNTMAGTFVSGQAYGGARTQMNLSGGSTLTDWHEPLSDAALTRAAVVLTPAQLSALRQVQEQQMAQLLSAPPVHSPDIPGNKGKPAAVK